MAEPEVLVDRYEVVRTLSEGPRASVHQAIDRVHGRPVALKVHPLDGDADEDLLAEARILMNLPPHRGVPTVRGDFFVDDPRRYVVVMNWVEGTNLQDVLDDDGDPGLPLHEVLEALEQVAAALDHLHAQDPPVVHGDVKPENLIRAAGGQVVLVDFELAATDRTLPDASVERLGTAGFVAPEVSAGEKPGPAADVYALAATAIALLNGHGPLEAHPTYPGLAPAVQGQVARVLRTGIATDPARRPKSATRLVANIRAASTAAPPSGVVALLACEVADAGRLWAEDAEAMRAAMSRLRDVYERVVDERRGWVAALMNEGDRTIAVFHEASSAASAALDLHERVAAAALPPGIQIGLRIGLAVGEAELVDGVYVGAVVDQVIRLRAAAAAGTTVVPEPTAELLVGLVGADVAIVPLGTIDLAGAPGTRAFSLRRPGASDPISTKRGRSEAEVDGGPGPRPASARDAARHLLTDAGRAVQRTIVLVPSTVAGIAAIYAVVLGEVLGFARLATTVALLAGVVAIVALVQQLLVAARPRRRAARSARSRWEVDVQRTDARRQLATRLASAAPTADSATGSVVLARLGNELRGVTELLQGEPTPIVSELLDEVPQLADDTYAHGVAAVTEAVQLFEVAGDPQRARELLLEAERCAVALGETRVALTSMHRADDRATIDQVVGPLEDSIARVRAVQDELRELGS